MNKRLVRPGDADYLSFLLIYWFSLWQKRMASGDTLAEIETK